MYFRSTLVCALVAATTTVFAAPEPEKVEARNFPGGPFPSDFGHAIASLIPTSVWADPSAVSSAVSAIHAGDYPSWYTSLPSDAKSYLSSWDDKWSSGSWPTDWASDWSSGSWPTDWSSGSWDSSAWTTATAYPTASVTNGTTNKILPTASAPFVTANFAARPTAMIGASFAGVVGVLGAALVL
ncbi:MAG: hypothetical protein M1840_001944 [Geoglossum simile]|nr:MAG: hypothetical protein M1840_001944 [Geoglossum simile]